MDDLSFINNKSFLTLDINFLHFIDRYFMIFNMSRQIQNSIKRLLRANERLQQYLVEIVRRVKPKAVTSVVNILNKLIANQLEWDHFFKVLILLNNFIVNDQIPLKQIKNILNLMKLKHSDNDDYENVLISELLLPYRLYLQKRCGLVEMLGIQQNEPKCFALINLLNSGACFSRMIFILARYYPTKLKYAEDFNIAWAADLSEIYYLMTKCISFPVQENTRRQLQLMHERLNNVFYNCYFYKHLVKFTPVWIKTDYFKPNPQYTQNKKRTEHTTAASRGQQSDGKSLNQIFINKLIIEKIQVSQFNCQQDVEINQKMDVDVLEFIQLRTELQHLEMVIRRESLQQLQY